MPRGPSRPQLSKEMIVAAAVEMIDDEGLAGLSMRRLGARLGFEGMALYRYVPSKDALIAEAVSWVMLEGGDALPPADRPWRQRLTTMYAGFRRNVLRHPHLAGLMLTRPAQGVGAARVLEAQYQALADAGLSGPALVMAHRTIGSYVVGFVSVEVVAMAETTAEPHWDLPSVDEFPMIAQAGAHAGDLSWDEQFHAGLGMLLDAVHPRRS
jgi:AcrR family transcriptional regulator